MIYLNRGNFPIFDRNYPVESQSIYLISNINPRVKSILALFMIAVQDTRLFQSQNVRNGWCCVSQPDHKSTEGGTLKTYLSGDTSDMRTNRRQCRKYINRGPP